MYVNKFNCQNVYAGNEEHRSIKGWVNIKKDAQEHIKRISLWHWQGFETVIEKASVGEFYTKINDNRTEILDIKDYTDSMKAMHKILTQSFLYSVQRKKGLPPFTVEFLKDGLRINWTAEMIGHLIIKYESEWYADEALTKWNEIDNLIEEEKQKQKNLIEKQLDENNITMPYKRDYALNMVDEVHEKTKSIWQLEKEQRIKPSLWWREVAQSQPTPQTSALSNLSADGKAWFIHPVSMLGRLINPGIVTYHIYHDGKIERYIPENINAKYKNKYIYHDKNNNFHQLGIYEYIIIKNKYLSWSDKRYGNTEYIHLIDLRKVCQEYEKHGLKYRFNVDSNQERYFMNRDTLASFFGAMLEVNFTDISCNGFSTKKGESGVSKSHKNGYHGDFKYLRKDKILYKGAGKSLNIKFHPEELDVDRQNQWIDALYKFGWTHMLGWSYTLKGKKYFLNHIPKETTDHDHHLHVEYYDMKKVKEIKG